MQVEEVVVKKGSSIPSQTNKYSSTVVGDIITAIGYVIMILGSVVGIIVGLNSSIFAELHPFRWIYGGGVIVSSFVSGMVFIGFGEIIKLLHNINERSKTRG